jgi:hypothetical protein
MTRKEAYRQLEYVRALRIRLLGDRVLQMSHGRPPACSGGRTLLTPNTSP